MNYSNHFCTFMQWGRETGLGETEVKRVCFFEVVWGKADASIYFSANYCCLTQQTVGRPLGFSWYNDFCNSNEVMGHYGQSFQGLRLH